MSWKNRKLTPNFWVSEAATTDRRGYRAQNREMALRRLPTIVLTLQLVEFCRKKIGDKRIHSESLYRYPDLNKVIGGSMFSQHMKGEACDFWPVGMERDRVKMRDAFWTCVRELRRERIMFGQFIFEKKIDKRGPKFWFHLSQGYPFRPLHRCGQVMSWSRKDGYLYLDRVEFPEYE